MWTTVRIATVCMRHLSFEAVGGGPPQPKLLTPYIHLIKINRKSTLFNDNCAVEGISSSRASLMKVEHCTYVGDSHLCHPSETDDKRRGHQRIGEQQCRVAHRTRFPASHTIIRGRVFILCKNVFAAMQRQTVIWHRQMLKWNTIHFGARIRCSTFPLQSWPTIGRRT